MSRSEARDEKSRQMRVFVTSGAVLERKDREVISVPEDISYDAGLKKYILWVVVVSLLDLLLRLHPGALI
jgi:hypothetical protein